MKSKEEILFPLHRHPILDGTELEAWVKYTDALQAMQDYADQELEQVKKERDEFEFALLSAIGTIRIWHGMGMPPQVEAKMWETYSENSPEMEAITRPFSKPEHK